MASCPCSLIHAETLDRIINQVEDEDLNPIAAVGLLLEFRDALHALNEQVTCTAMGCETIQAAGWATCEGDGWYPYCIGCLRILESTEIVSFTLARYP